MRRFPFKRLSHHKAKCTLIQADMLIMKQSASHSILISGGKHYEHSYQHQHVHRCFQFCSRSQLGTDFLSEHRYIHQKVRPFVPLNEKWLLTIPEAAAYFGVGQNRISELALQDGCKFVVFVGNTKRIKRKKFEEFLDEQYAI